MIEGFDKMTSALKTIVSKNKRRYQENGYNLDLAYISDRLIAMGYPSEKLEAMFRNSLEEVKQFLDEMHKDHYRIYNLCSERDYDAKKFHGRVVNFPFDDHNPPNFNSIRLFCEDAEKWLLEHKENVCVVHCKAGKGRTGVMICCFLLHSHRRWTANEALAYYGKARTLDSKGVTIPSQKRYISYYYHYLRENLDYLPTPMYLSSVSISSYFPSITTQNNTIYVEVHQMNYKKTEPSTQKIYESKGFNVKRSDHQRLEIPINVAIAGDVKIEFHSKGIPTKKELFHLWFNTAFVEVENELSHFLSKDPLPSFSHPSTNNGGSVDIGHLLKNVSISDDHLLSERLSSDSSHSSTSSNPSENHSSTSSNPSENHSSSSFRDKRVRHSSVPQTGVARNNSSHSGKHIELSLNKSQLDKFPKDKSRRSDERFSVCIHLIKPEKQSSWTPPPGLHPTAVSGGISYSSPESSSTEEEPSASDVFQQGKDAPVHTWI
ncbi:phosphatidylinositol 3,4,5-trisphosphate 3-phosphatase and dual-specificity protein phosphatase PTEN [Lepeophtheirus salmonis]|uniref:phosphatidylinositol 3,4,5-trisphosphate 3-phosphatase and dual-specificity protein phosphatase PTEN n=1 Tax=Lepeophtheirus salmonis TaxID=72036 RepID=UPI001AE81AB8|nr:phosphatidylinositol 3,4,5-trisphosphate 3-phosphatase and dual-specificity protein phosphatase PTEN-like isoform X1 [Lepeophtheirus salmonis]